MSRKDYVLIAKALLQVRREANKHRAIDVANFALDRVNNVLAEALKADNPNFNEKKFLRAAGQYGL